MIELLLTMRNASCSPAPGDTRMLIVAPGVFLVRGSQLATVWTVTEGNSVEWAPAPHLAHGAVFSAEHQDLQRLCVEILLEYPPLHGADR